MARSDNGSPGSTAPRSAAAAARAVEFTKQAEKLSHKTPEQGNVEVAVEAKFITPLDPVIITSDGNRLPGVPIPEALKLNSLKSSLDENDENDENDEAHRERDEARRNLMASKPNGKSAHKSAEGTLRKAMPPSHTNPLFPPLPLYGPPSILRDLQCATFRVSSFFLSMAFLGVIVLGSLFTSIPGMLQRMWLRVTLRNPQADRPFYEEEKKRAAARKEMERNWTRRDAQGYMPVDDEKPLDDGGYVPTEGGPDPIKCDVGYYARRVGLDVEEFEVQTEDGFIIDLWHVYDPRDYEELSAEARSARGPGAFSGETRKAKKLRDPGAARKYPVLLIHGLLQSAGAYCVNDEQSLAFWLCKSGYDVWLGNNRCGFKPKHVLLDYSDPRMWCWNIRQMGVFDLPALTSRVLYETGFARCGLIAHSQGTTETFVALAKEQRPELGEKLSVFCALAPAAYAGPLIGKMYFKFMRVITPAMFRFMFGLHAFIPIMMTMHGILNGRLYGWMGYKVFSFLFDWTDARWDRGLRDRMFQFAPVYVSAESMRWWLGRECFAKHKCILATKEEWRAEEREDAADRHQNTNNAIADVAAQVHDFHDDDDVDTNNSNNHHKSHPHHHHVKGARAWYNAQSPPFALWVCGQDNLVDGDKLLRRFARGREPQARLIHATTIPEYEHLDVIWAMDAETKVFMEVREVLWRTVAEEDRAKCRVPLGCESVAVWVDDRKRRREGDGEGEDEEEVEESESSSSSSSEELSM
ncbi:Alpha/Beta hydrolase protein [Coniella lustricola]|uniref:Alpha/Beta hydrolase protein n=1 Tax=Coniella lustricola TaxID=2025994 RepID=A0A2T3AD02_9PEZI|nr:Alpha/Beta hydrolase protein [Coniella lustricola]